MANASCHLTNLCHLRHMYHMSWVSHKRSDARKAAGSSFISLRPMGIAFNAGFTREAGLGRATRVSIVIDGERRRLGFRFHAREDDQDAYALTSDGAGANSRWIQSQRLYSEYGWLGQALEWPLESRRFSPEFDARNEVWFITVPEHDWRGWAKRKAEKQ